MKGENADTKKPAMRSAAKRLAFTALFAALCCVGTMFIVIPLPHGYFNAGDVFVLLAGWCMGPVFGSVAAAKALPERWEDYPLADAKAYGAEEAEPLIACRKNLLRHGYDENKPPEAWTIEDMRQAAKFRGGKCLSGTMGKTPYDKLVWECCEGHTFEAAPYTVLIGGHWCPDCMPQPWEFDRLAKKVPYFAQVWYDSHSSDEDARYFLDDGTARAERGEVEK